MEVERREGEGVGERKRERERKEENMIIILPDVLYKSHPV